MSQRVIVLLFTFCALLLLGGCAAEPAATATASPAPPATLPASPVATVAATVGALGMPTEPGSPVPPGMGTVEVRVTDAPPPGVTAVLVTTKSVQVHRAGAGEEVGWETVISAETTFDLVAVTGLEKVLGSNPVAAGDYTQVRLEIVSVMLKMDNQDVSATVPSDRLKVVGGFTVEEGGTTALTLDFDADKSVVITGQGRAQFKPVVKLLVTKRPKPTPPPPPPTAAASGAAQATPIAPSPQATSAPTAASVEVGDSYFRSRTVRISRGGTVTWTNRGQFAHTTTDAVRGEGTSERGQVWNQPLAPGVAFSRTFDEAGTFQYICAIHASQGMRGTIEVTP